MATTTPNYGWPVPTSTDYVKDGATAIEALGDAIDTTLGTGLLAWTSYTPTLTNLTLGNGTMSAAYAKIGKLVVVRFRMVFGSTSSMGSFPGVTLPFTAVTNTTSFFTGSTQFEDAGTRNWLGHSRIATTTTFDWVIDTVVGSRVSIDFLSSTAPMTWAVNDNITTIFMYECV